MNRKEYLAEWKRNNKQKVREHNRKWKRDNRDKVRASKRRWRQRNKGDKRRDYNLKQLYGITSEWFYSKLEEQGGGCAICGAMDKGRKVRSLHVDHSHKSKLNRGILCELCNHAVERLENIPDWAKKAEAYLDRYSD
jgi:Recombination endonuclease VII